MLLDRRGHLLEVAIENADDGARRHAIAHRSEAAHVAKPECGVDLGANATPELAIDHRRAALRQRQTSSSELITKCAASNWMCNARTGASEFRFCRI